MIVVLKLLLTLSLSICRPGKEHLRSSYFAYPLVDTKVLLASIAVPIDPATSLVTVDDKYFAFDAGFKVPNGEDDEFTPQLLLSKDPLTKINSKSSNIPSPDFMMVASTGSFQLQRAYFARFVHPKHPGNFIIWSGFVNMSKPQIQMQGTHSMSHVSYIMLSSHFI